MRDVRATRDKLRGRALEAHELFLLLAEDLYACQAALRLCAQLLQLGTRALFMCGIVLRAHAATGGAHRAHLALAISDVSDDGAV